MKTSDVARFWSKVDREGPGSSTARGRCWIWSAATFTSGYGAFYVSGKQRRAHRVAWEISHGPIADGQLVLHRCDRPTCVNPDHLFLGSSADNEADKLAKGRGVTGDQHWTRKQPEKLARGAEASARMERWAADNREKVPRGKSHWRQRGTKPGRAAAKARTERLGWYYANRDRINEARRDRYARRKGHAA